MNEKKQYELAIKKSVSMPEILADEANARRREMRLSTFSDYIQFAIRSDLNAQRISHQRQQQAAA